MKILVIALLLVGTAIAQEESLAEDEYDSYEEETADTVLTPYVGGGGGYGLEQKKLAALALIGLHALQKQNFGKGGYGELAHKGHLVEGLGGYGKHGLVKGFGEKGAGAHVGFGALHGHKGAYADKFAGGHTKAFSNEKKYGLDQHYLKGARGGIHLDYGKLYGGKGIGGYGKFGGLGYAGLGKFDALKGYGHAGAGKGYHHLYGHGLSEFDKVGKIGGIAGHGSAGGFHKAGKGIGIGGLGGGLGHGAGLGGHGLGGLGGDSDGYTGYKGLGAALGGLGHGLGGGLGHGLSHYGR